MRPTMELTGREAWEFVKKIFPRRTWPGRRKGSTRWQKRLSDFRILLLIEAFIAAHPWTERDDGRDLFAARTFGICFLDTLDSTRPTPATEGWHPDWKPTGLFLDHDFFDPSYGGKHANRFVAFWDPSHPCFAAVPAGLRMPNADILAMAAVWTRRLATGQSLADIGKSLGITTDQARRYFESYTGLREKLCAAGLNAKRYRETESLRTQRSDLTGRMFEAYEIPRWLLCGPDPLNQGRFVDRMLWWLQHVGEPTPVERHEAPPDEEFGRPLIQAIGIDQRTPSKSYDGPLE